MAARFELVVDHAGRFHFQLRSPAGCVLLRSVAAPTKVEAQADIRSLRTALRDPARIGPWQGADGFLRILVTGPDGSLLAKSPRLNDMKMVPRVAGYIRAAIEDAPVIDLTQHDTQAAAH